MDNYTGHADAKGYHYGGLFYVLRGTVKDLTIDNANVTCFRGGALVGRMDQGSVENCHVKNVMLTGYQKVAGRFCQHRLQGCDDPQLLGRSVCNQDHDSGRGTLSGGGADRLPADVRSQCTDRGQLGKRHFVRQGLRIGPRCGR